MLNEFRKLTDAEYSDVRVEMYEVAMEGLGAARHLRGDIYEVRVETGSGLARRFGPSEGRRATLTNISVQI